MSVNTVLDNMLEEFQAEKQEISSDSITGLLNHTEKGFGRLVKKIIKINLSFLYFVIM